MTGMKLTTGHGLRAGRSGILPRALPICQGARGCAAEASRKVAVDYLFGETKKPDTHRQCTIYMRDRLDWKTCGVGFSVEN